MHDVRIKIQQSLVECKCRGADDLQLLTASL